jgi:hypothetical protein
MVEKPDTEDEPRAARKARYALYVAGGFFAALGIALELVPLFAEFTPVKVAKGCALLGALILGIGRFAPDPIVLRIEALLARPRDRSP